MLIHIRRGDKNTASTEQLAVSALRPRLIPYLYGNCNRVWSVTRIDINNVRRLKHLELNSSKKGASYENKQLHLLVP